ncbi:MAG TPA: hypothetical protein VHA13_00635 [Gammaproteobacteria bacterium]|nr:hypothetical protein [Gammaproteobacteria bacterium]
MDPRTLSDLKSGPAKAFNTRDIMIYLCKKEAQQDFPSDTAAKLAGVDYRIAALHNSIGQYMSPASQQQIETIKSLLMTAKDSPKRKELSQTVVELDARLVNLNAQGQNLSEQSNNIIKQFRDLKKSNAISGTSLEQIKRELDNLSKISEPFKQDEESLLEKINHASQEVAKMTGTPVETITAVGREFRL